jgi:DivIVA domain-containing protein
MALTPEDVVNKRFQPTKFREGYDQDEVDDFLDEVVVELRRLTQENDELRQRLISGESRGGEQASAPKAAEVEQVQPQYVAAPVVAAPVPAPVAYSSSDQDAIDSGSTNNLLQLARKLHEEHVREGIEKRDALIAEGHATAARVVSEAEAAQRAQISTLEQERSVLEQEKTAVEREKIVIEQQIDELRTFERDYRQKLKSYIEGQLRDLDSTEGQSAEPGAALESVSASGSNAQSAPPSFQGFGGN